MSMGAPGKPRKTGRKPNWFREWCDQAIDNPRVLAKLEKALLSNDFNIWFPVFKELEVIAHGKAPQSHEINGSLNLTLEQAIVQSNELELSKNGNH